MEDEVASSLLAGPSKPQRLLSKLLKYHRMKKQDQKQNGEGELR
jgi:hypothetical protein